MPDADLSKLRIERDPSALNTSRLRRVWPWLLAFVALVGGGYYAFGHRPAQVVEIVTVTQAYPSQGYTQLNATGYVVAQRKAAVASKATGRLEWLNVREGSEVKANEVIARLESKDVAASLQQARASVNVARANLEQGLSEMRDAERALARSRDLLAKNFVSASAHDVVVARHEKAVAGISGLKAAIAVADANVRSAEVAVEQTLIRAPFDGVVLTKNANVGDVITPFSSALGSQAAVVTMADMTTLEVEADVSESSLGKIKPDQPCEIQLDALPQKRLRGVVHRIAPTVDRSKATVLAKIRFVDRDPAVLPDMSAKVAFLTQEIPEAQRAARTVVQPAAIVERNGKKVVFLVQDGKVVETPIVTGERIGDVLTVTQGVKPGDKIVNKPAEKLHTGVAVTAAAK
jgi:RND family efflux transporter MFP subunit